MAYRPHFPEVAMLAYPLPALLIAFAMTLAVSALGFRRVDWFVSLGYAFSIAAQAVFFLVVWFGQYDRWAAIQSLLLLAYGLRLGSYLVSRERSPSFARELQASKERGLHIKGWLKLTIWISVAALYVAMYAPGLITLSAQAQGNPVATLPFGILIMVAGLAIETVADWQKARFKAANPSRFCDVGLFRIVRCPNYFGEMVFWAGAWISAIAAYSTLLDWLISLIGLVCIQLIMLGSARRLEMKQGERYGSDLAYQAYERRVPILFPLLPVYSLRGLKVYLG
jgi:steroid 5-alpha reductase family enzyme